MKTASSVFLTVVCAMSLFGQSAASTNYKPVPGAANSVSVEDALKDRFSCTVVYGMVGDGTHGDENYAALVRCMSARRNVYLGPDKNGLTNFYIGNHTLTPPASLKGLTADAGISITCDSFCWDIKGLTDAELAIPMILRHGGSAWHAGTPDTSSIGARTAANTNSKITFAGAKYFHRGLLLCGGNSTPGDACNIGLVAGQYHVEYRWMKVHDNKIGVDVQGDAGGFNQVQIYGGEVRMNGSECQTLATIAGKNANRPWPGTRGLRIQSGSAGSNNMQIYIGLELQAGGECVEQTLEDNSGQIYHGVRFETQDYMEVGSVGGKGSQIYNPYIGSGTPDMFARTLARTVNVDATGLLITRTAGQPFTGTDAQTNFGVGVVICGITYAVASVTDGDHLTLSGSPYPVLSACRTSGQAMMTIIDPASTFGTMREGVMLFGSPSFGWHQDFGFGSRPIINLSATNFSYAQVDVAGDGVSITWRSGSEFGAIPLGANVRVEGDLNDRYVVAKADAQHLTLNTAIGGPAVGATNYTMYVPQQVMTLTRTGALYARSFSTPGTISAASYNGVRIVSTYAPCLGSVAGCARVETGGASPLPFEFYNSSNSYGGLKGSMFESTSGGMLFGDAAGKNRLGALGPTAARRFQFTCADNGVSSCGLEVGYFRANNDTTLQALTATTFNTTRISTSGPPCLGDVAGCHRIYAGGSSPLVFEFYNSSNTLTGLKASMFESSTAGMLFGDTAGKNRLGALGPTAARRFQFTCADNGVSSCGLEVGYFRANNVASFQAGASFSAGIVDFTGSTVTLPAAGSAGSCGSATTSCGLTFDAAGRETARSDITIAIPATAVASGSPTFNNVTATGTITSANGYTSGASAGLSVTKTVRDAAGTGTCTLVFTGGLLTGGTC